MCLITFRIAAHPTYKLVLAANRDEAYNRPTADAHFWPTYPSLLAGQDLEANGTWMGMTKSGKIAAITNCHDQAGNVDEQTYTADSAKKSRGKIVTDYLTSDWTPEAYLEHLVAEKHAYQPFNILLGDINQLYHFNSREAAFSLLTKGTHSVSNATLNTPWPKVRKTKQTLDALLTEESLFLEDLFQMMHDATPAKDEELPSSPLPLELKRQVSANFIQTKDFGTRSTTVLLVDHQNNVTFVERIYQNGQYDREQVFTFEVEDDF